MRMRARMSAAGAVTLLLAAGMGVLAVEHRGTVFLGTLVMVMIWVSIVLATVGIGLVAGHTWARIVGLVVAGLVILGGVADYRGWASAVGIALGLVIGALLAWPARSSNGSGAPAERPAARTAA